MSVAADQPTTPLQLSSHLRGEPRHNGGERCYCVHAPIASRSLADCLEKKQIRGERHRPFRPPSDEHDHRSRFYPVSSISLCNSCNPNTGNLAPHEAEKQRRWCKRDFAQPPQRSRFRRPPARRTIPNVKAAYKKELLLQNAGSIESTLQRSFVARRAPVKKKKLCHNAHLSSWPVQR